jgi:branched-chain amino acid transport system substrate-binding protein
LSGQASEAWAKWTNAHGGINGHQVKIIVEDDSSNPTTAENEIKTLVQQDHVQAIVGDGSLVDTGWAPYVQQQGIPVIGGSPVDAPMYTNPDFFPNGTSTPNQFTGNLLEVDKLNKTNLGVMYCAQAAICAGVVTIQQEASKVVTGGKVAISGVQVSTTSPNYDAPCLAVKSAGADALFIGTTGPTVIRIVDQCSSLGVTPLQIGTGTIFTPQMLQDKNFNGSYWVSPSANFLDTSIPGIETFTQAMQQYIPGSLTSPEFSMTLAWQWTAGQLFAAAVQEGNLTPSSSYADIKAALYKLKDTTLDGLTVPLTFNPGKPNNIRGYFVQQQLNGKWVGNTLGTVSAAQSAAVAQKLGLPS